MKSRLPAVPVIAWVMLVALLASWLLTWSPTATAAVPADSSLDLEARSRALQRAQQSVLGVQAVAVDEARSANTLGKSRSGSGAVTGTLPSSAAVTSARERTGGASRGDSSGIEGGDSRR